MYVWPKFRGSGTKIRAAALFTSSKLKWAWHAQFLSYTFQILQKYTTFDAQMTLLPCLKILALKRIYKKIKSLRVHLHDVHCSAYAQLSSMLKVLEVALLGRIFCHIPTSECKKIVKFVSKECKPSKCVSQVCKSSKCVSQVCKSSF